MCYTDEPSITPPYMAWESIWQDIFGYRPISNATCELKYGFSQALEMMRKGQTMKLNGTSFIIRETVENDELKERLYIKAGKKVIPVSQISTHLILSNQWA